jgi:hypothetical protein
LCPYAPAVADDYASHYGEPHTSAREFLGAVEPLEHTEELIDVAHVEPCSVVVHLLNRLSL